MTPDIIIKAPASKSLGIRAAVCNFLSGNKGRIFNYPLCEDATNAKYALRSLEHAKQSIELDCGESALFMRIISPVCALLGIDASIKTSGTLVNRPTGIDAECLKALSSNGKLVGGKAELDASITSQFLSGLLIALPLAKNDTTLTVKNLKSRPYVDTTIKLLSGYGIKIKEENSVFYIAGGQKYEAVDYIVEGDFSGASAILVAGAIKREIRVEDLYYKSSLQPEKAIVDVLKNCGAGIKIADNYVEVKPGDLRSFEYDVSDNPDLAPPLCALAVHCKGASILKGIHRLKYKESDRALALCKQFTKLGADIKIVDDRIEINGGTLTANRVNAHNDHRIVMALAVAGINLGNELIIDGADRVKKSYPDFFNDLVKIKKA